MNNAPLNIMQKISAPIQKATKAFANYVYSNSKDVATMMLFAFGASTFSSHIAQRNGLRKSNRENKEFLIKQENTELFLDLALTIIPPFLLKNILNKKFLKGEILTKSDNDFLQFTMSPLVKMTKADMFAQPEKMPVREIIGDKVNSIKGVVKNSRLLPENYTQNIKINNVVNVKKPAPSLEDCAHKFDSIVKQYKNNILLMPDEKSKRAIIAARDGLYKGSAYSDICGEKEGLLIIATVLYTIITANIIMPILKNKIANDRYRRELALRGETPESIRRKKRFNFYDSGINKLSGNNIFNSVKRFGEVGKNSDNDNCEKSNLNPFHNKVFSEFNRSGCIKI